MFRSAWAEQNVAVISVPDALRLTQNAPVVISMFAFCVFGNNTEHEEGRLLGCYAV
jgi:hypothetical protein